jgi:hypothetical protein
MEVLEHQQDTGIGCTGDRCGDCHSGIVNSCFGPITVVSSSIIINIIIINSYE